MSDAELNGHLDRVEECLDWVNAEIMEGGDTSGRLRDFVVSMQFLIDALTTARTERDEAVRVLAMVRDDFDRAIAAHDPSDARHPSHGGQHTNGRCCAFGNVAPGALTHMRRLRDAITAALTGKGTP